MESMDNPLVVWPLYEPSSQRAISLDERALVQHVLVIGSTGCGKTTLLLSAAQQLIRSRLPTVGLLILDAKQDCSTLDLIVKAASQAGRSEDLVILGSHPQATHALSLFGRLKSYEDVELLTQWLLLTTDPMGGENRYWQNTTASMVSAALTLLRVRRDLPITYTTAVEFMRCWFARTDPGGALAKPVADVVERAERESKKAGACSQLAGALDHVEVWRHLDPRTRSNLQSCLLNIIRPLVSAAASRCFAANDLLEFDPAEVADGRICYVTVNALSHPDLAKFVMRLARRQFFDTIQMRQRGPHKLAGVLADELSLIIQPEDSDQLATLRSRRTFVLSATQNLSGIDLRIGEHLRRSVLQNFNTLVFMRSREIELGELATLTLGTKEQRPRSRSGLGWEEGAVATQSRSDDRAAWVCPPGALGRLQSHQGFVAGADGSRTELPVWFVPWFEAADETESRRVAEGIASRYVERLMGRCGFKVLLPPELVLATANFSEHRYDHALMQAGNFFRSKACRIPEGLETLPACWLRALPGILWATRKPHWSHLPYMISRVACENGVLVLNFAQEEPSEDDHMTVWDEIRVTVNRKLYPCRWRHLKRRHRMLLLSARPDLRPALSAGTVALF